MSLRKDVRDSFNKGVPIEDEIYKRLYFLDNDAKEMLDRLSRSYDRVVTPEDFKAIGVIMRKHLGEETPILDNFTKFLGKLGAEYLEHSKPSEAAFDWSTLIKEKIRGTRSKGYILSDRLSEFLGVKAGEPVSEKFLKRFSFWNPNSGLADMILGVAEPKYRKTGGKYFKLDVTLPGISIKDAKLLKEKTLSGIEVGIANKLPKSWTNIPSVNFDGKVIEQNFTQRFEERLIYKKDGVWTTNILGVNQKSEMSWVDQLLNKSGQINDIADATKARTAFAVNSNHSNDATIVKRLHLWGRKNNITTGTIHDAFFGNAADMLDMRQALREIYAESLERNVIKLTLDEMLKRGLPREIYDRYLEEAIELGLIPVPGKSKVGGKLLREEDILKKEDILKLIPKDFLEDYGWYGVG